MKTQLMAEFAAMKQNQLELEKIVREQQEFLREQRAELASLREALAQKTANRPAPIVTAAAPVSPAPVQLKAPDTSRRKMLKRMGLAVLAGGAALGIKAATYAPAEAKLSVNPSSNVGATVTRIGATITGIPTSLNYGLIASADDSFDAGSLLPVGNIGVVGNSSSGNGVVGYSISGKGVYGNSSSGNGVFGGSTDGYGVYGVSSIGTSVYGVSSIGTGIRGETFTATSTAIKAKNSASTSGIALQIEQGGLTVTGAGIGTQTAAFVHQTTAGNITNNYSKIDNPLCNGRQNALLFVTHNWNPTNSIGVYELNTYGIFYGTGFWYIFLEGGSSGPAMPVGVYFNVLIINP